MVLILHGSPHPDPSPAFTCFGRQAGGKGREKICSYGLTFGKREPAKKVWRGAQLTVLEVLVYPEPNKWAHANDVSLTLIASTPLENLPVFQDEVLSAMPLRFLKR